MIYLTLKKLTKIALNVYFRKIHIKGLEHIPEEGPFIIVANHPSSFLDPISIAAFVKQKISFLAKGSMFSNKLIAGILSKLNMIPIYRAQDDPKMLGKNKEVFKGCYQKLSDKGVIMIFPEGTSENERKLRKIKTGAARIALGAAKANGYNLNVKILPVGLNYTKSSRFRSEIFIEFAPFISSEDYIENYKNDEIKTTKMLTNDIEKSIKNLIIDIDKDEFAVLTERIESLLKNHLTAKEIDKDQFKTITTSQEIYKGIKYFQEKDKPLFNMTKKMVNTYFFNLKEIGISDKSIEKGTQQRNIGCYFLKNIPVLILGFPLWVFGYLHSFVPYKFPRFVALKISKSEAFYGALLMAIGTFSFILFYGLMVLLCWQLSHNPPITIGYALLLPASGFFTIFYARVARKIYYNLKFLKRLVNQQTLFLALLQERPKIRNHLEEMSILFMEKTK